MKAVFPLAMLALALSPGFAAAQWFPPEGPHRQFAFHQRYLTIEVDGASAGAVHIVRGEPGRLAVTAHADRGFATFALANESRDKLRLMPIGAAFAEYLVVVPEHVWLNIELPDGVNRLAPSAPAATYEWTAQPRAVRTVSHGTLVPGRSLLPSYRDRETPDRLLFQGDLGAIEVRIGGDEFEVLANRALRAPHRGGRSLAFGLEGSTGVIVRVPAGADMVVIANGETLLAVRDGVGSTPCSRVTAQRFVGGDQRFTFSPAAGSVACR